ANNTAGADTITLPIGTYALIGGQIQITDDLNINGANSRLTVIDGGGIDRIFRTRNTSVVSLSMLALLGGPASNGRAGHVDDSSTLNVTDAIVTSNDGQGGRGGAFQVRATLNLNRVSLSNNTASKGGAISFEGATVGSLTNVTLSGNTATSDGGALWT